MMKKLTALILVCLLLCSCALAEVVQFADAGLTLDIGSTTILELDDDEEDEDIALIFVNDTETLECYVYVYEADGDTLADIAADLAEDPGTADSGYTTINGVNAYYWLGKMDGEDYIEYYTLENDVVTMFSFFYADEAAAQLSAAIMNTLTKE